MNFSAINTASDKQTNHGAIQTYVVLGGGTAGWISAAILIRSLVNTNVNIHVVESPHAPTVGVGEATIPSIMDMLQYLNIPAQDFINKTNATFKLAIKFTDWYAKGTHYWHPFGYIGNEIDGKPFYQHWLKYQQQGGALSFTDFSPAIALAKQNKFFIPDPKQPTNLSSSSYALHFDAALVAKYLQQYCETRGVKIHKAHVKDVKRDNTGNISQLVFNDDKTLSGDFFIDCSGQQGLLIGKTLRVGYENWQQYLPVDSAAVVQTENSGALPPYTESIAHAHGWRWRIPLQNRTGNGYVYCSDFCDDNAAMRLLESNVLGEKLTDTRCLKFTTGMRDKCWEKNCLAVGLSSGFLEPLESTSIYLIMRAMLNFVQSIPTKEPSPFTVSEYNRLMRHEYHCIRDFIVLHYCATTRKDTPFWQMWQNLSIPDSLQTKIALFKEYGRLYQDKSDLFSQDSWYAVLEGMGVRPKAYDPVVDASVAEKIHSALPSAAEALIDSAGKALGHEEYLKRIR